MKITLALLALLFIGITSCQQAYVPVRVGDTSLPLNSIELSEFMKIYYEFNPDDSITVAIECKLPGQFFGFGFGTQMLGADIWAFELINSEIVPSDRTGIGHEKPVHDNLRSGKDDLERLGYEITPTHSLVKVRRALNTGDPNDAVISKGEMHVLFSTGKSPTLIYHRNTRGRAVLNL